jgi:hypothetical protein
MRAFSPAFRKTAFWILFAVALAANFVLVGCGFSAALGHQLPNWFYFKAASLAFLAVGLILVWCAIFVREEPRLVRLAVSLVAVDFILRFALNVLH